MSQPHSLTRGRYCSRTLSTKVRLHTDESNLYPAAGKDFAAHETVKHTAYEYVRGDLTTNTVESYFSCSSGECTACISIARKALASLFRGI